MYVRVCTNIIILINKKKHLKNQHISFLSFNPYLNFFHFNQINRKDLSPEIIFCHSKRWHLFNLHSFWKLKKFFRIIFLVARNLISPSSFLKINFHLEECEDNPPAEISINCYFVRVWINFINLSLTRSCYVRMMHAYM